jgi:tetratricopeptide (TPR) repeat protein
VNLAQNYAFIGNSAKSLPLLRQALALAADDRSVEYTAGETYEVLGQRNKAIALLAKALASGYRVAEFERNPGLAPLRADPSFQAALKSAKEEISRLHP